MPALRFQLFVVFLLVSCTTADYGPYREAPTVEHPLRSMIVRVQPVYPNSAVKSELEGWVLVGFTIDADGSTKDIEVIDQYPGNVFGRPTVEAVKFWRYMPANSDTPANEVLIFELEGDLMYSKEGN